MKGHTNAVKSDYHNTIYANQGASTVNLDHSATTPEAVDERTQKRGALEENHKQSTQHTFVDAVHLSIAQPPVNIDAPPPTTPHIAQPAENIRKVKRGQLHSG
jgi:hypothetical protein